MKNINKIYIITYFNLLFRLVIILFYYIFKYLHSHLLKIVSLTWVNFNIIYHCFFLGSNYYYQSHSYTLQFVNWIPNQTITLNFHLSLFRCFVLHLHLDHLLTCFGLGFQAIIDFQVVFDYCLYVYYFCIYFYWFAILNFHSNLYLLDLKLAQQNSLNF